VVIKLDVRPGHDHALAAKVESVERHLAEPTGREAAIKPAASHPGERTSGG
jgi:hypothetical protein